VRTYDNAAPVAETVLPSSRVAEAHSLAAQARSLAKDKNYRGAIPLLEHARAMLAENPACRKDDLSCAMVRQRREAAQPVGDPQTKESNVRQLFEEALRLKKNKEYLQAIAMLEEAKLKTA